MVVERAEIDALLNAAPDHLRLWILLCSDLAIRSGTASRINPQQYSAEGQALHFVTKYRATLTLPVTDEIRELIAKCDMRSKVSFVRQLWRREPVHRGGRRPAEETPTARRLNVQFQQLCAKVGIPRRIIPHDLRRTTAVAMLEATHDIRDVQALLGHRSLPTTLWYLDHDIRPVQRTNLELIKRPSWRREETQ